MRDSNKGKGPVSKPVSESADRTFSFVVCDPKVEAFTFMKSGKELQPFREYLSKFTLTENNAGLRFGNFINNLRGVSKYPDFIVARTRKSISLISTKKRPDASVLYNEQSGMTIYLTRIRYDELVKLTSDVIPGEGTSIDPDGSQVNLDEMKMRLMRGRITKGKFDLRAFASGLTYAGIFNDESNSTHYVLADDSNVLMLYVNSEPLRDSKVLCVFKYSGKVCTLCEEDIAI
jgi:hypothetical protein